MATPVMSQPQVLSVKEKVGYALGDTATNFVWRAVITFLPIFLTDVAGIGPAAVGVLLLVCRVWDGVTDLGMGVVADRTATRWGKFRPWILWTAVPFGVLGVLTFTAPDFSDAGRLAYAYATYSLLIVIYTMSNVPYSSLMGVMSPSPAERASISSYRFVFAFLGGLFLYAFTPSLVLALQDPAQVAARTAAAWAEGGLSVFTGAFYAVVGAIAAVFDTSFFHGLYGDGPAFPYTAAMTFFGVIAAALFVVTFATTRERVLPVSGAASTFREDLGDLARSGPWLVLFALGILFVTFTTLKNGTIQFYFTYYVGNAELSGLVLVLGLLGAMAGSALTGPLARRMGKRRLMLYAIGLAVVSNVLLYLPGPDDLALMVAVNTVNEFSTGPIVTLFFAMLADTADHSEWRTGRRATGLFYSAGTVAMKFGSGLGGALTGLLLAAFGYVAATGGQAAVAQTPEAIHGIRLLISVVPAVVGLLMLGAFLLYKLDEGLLAQVEADLATRRAREA